MLVYFKYRRGFRHRSYWQFSHTPHTNFPQLSTTGSTVWNLAQTPHTYPLLNFCQKSIVIGVLQITAATRLPHWHWNHCISHKVLLQLSRAGPLPWSARGIYATPMPIFSLKEANEKSPIRNTPCALMIARTLRLEVTCDLGETSTRCFLLPFATQQKKLHPVRKHFPSSPWASRTLRNQVIKQQHLVGASSQKKENKNSSRGPWSSPTQFSTLQCSLLCLPIALAWAKSRVIYYRGGGCLLVGKGAPQFYSLEATILPTPFVCIFFFNVPHISTMLTTALYVFCLCSSSTAHNSGRFFERGKGEGAVLCFTVLIAQLALLCDHREGKKPLRCKNSTIFSIQKGQTQNSQKIQWSLE